MSSIFFSPYKLETAAFSSPLPLNSFSFIEGVLFKVIFSDKKVGYSCLQVWPKLGGMKLKEHLEALKKGKETKKIKNALRLASLYKSPHWKKIFQKSSISNHYLITDLFKFSKQGQSKLKELKEQGFKCLKIKLNAKSLIENTDILKNLFSSTFSFLFRLDFNHSLKEKEFEIWLEKNQNWLLKHLDFIEDPFFYQEESWIRLSEKFGLSLAFDQGDLRQKENTQGSKINKTWGGGINVFVLKPTLENPEEVFKKYQFLSREGKKSLRFVFTHNMDHLLGQLLSLMEAERHRKTLKNKLSDCGLLSGNLYKNFPFLLEGQGKEQNLIQLNRNHERKIDAYLKNLPWKFLTKRAS